MLNYIKSEFYRVIHSTATYITAFVFAVLPLSLNFILFLLRQKEPDYRYACTSFSFSNIVASPMLFCVSAAVIVYVLYEGNKKNGTLKNVIAAGVSREKIFFGQLAVSFVTSAVILIITETVYILSAALLLRNEGPITVTDMVQEVGAIILIATAGLILAVLLVQLFDRSIVGVLVWYSVMTLIPKVLFYLGLKVPAIMKIAMWMPENFLTNMQVTFSESILIWNNEKGLAKCLIAGGTGIIIFTIVGVMGLRKKEL